MTAPLPRTVEEILAHPWFADTATDFETGRLYDTLCETLGHDEAGHLWRAACAAYDRRHAPVLMAELRDALDDRDGADEILARLSPPPVNGCSCGTDRLFVIEFGYERWEHARLEDGRWVGYTRGLEAFGDEGSGPEVLWCQDCGTVYATAELTWN